MFFSIHITRTPHRPWTSGRSFARWSWIRLCSSSRRTPAACCRTWCRGLCRSCFRQTRLSCWGKPAASGCRARRRNVDFEETGRRSGTQKWIIKYTQSNEESHISNHFRDSKINFWQNLELCETQMMIYQMSDSFDCESSVEMGSFCVEQKMFFAVKEEIAIFGNPFVLRVFWDFTEVLKWNESRLKILFHAGPRCTKTYNILAKKTCCNKPTVLKKDFLMVKESKWI